MNSEFRLLTFSDVEQAARVLSQAFMDDPLCSFLLPFGRTRGRTLYKFFRAYGEVNIKNNRGYGSGEPLEGVAYWDFPDQADVSISLKSLTVFLPLLFTMYPIGYFRARKIIQQIDDLHKQYASESHYYLDNIGVLPAARGKRISSKLIHPVLEMADSQKVVAYTDTVTHSNVALYEHFGFQCVAEASVPGTNITVWALRRPSP
jgi:ribosomal protein S18 acetylase RimI-like enzyme